MEKKKKSPNHELTPAEQDRLDEIYQYLFGAETEEERQVEEAVPVQNTEQIKKPWYKKVWQGLVSVNETANKGEKIFMDAMSPDNNLRDTLINKYRRYKALKEARKRGFESFADFRLLDIEIDSIEKQPYGATLDMFEKNLDRDYYDVYGRMQKERADIERIGGKLIIESPLFGSKPETMEWKAYIYQTKQEAKAREYSIELYWHRKIDYVISGAWADIEVPDIVQEQGDKIGLDTEVNAHVPEYNRYYHAHSRGQEVYSRIPVNVPTRLDKLYYIQVTRKVFKQLRKYVKQHCFTDEAINPEYVNTKFQVSTEISQQIAAEQEQEIISGLQNRQFDEKIFYYGLGAQKFLEILKSPEYKLSSLEQKLIEENIGVLAPDLQGRTIYDLGAANAMKALPLLEQQLKEQEQVEYVPVDINPSLIFAAAANINNPKVKVSGKVLDFTKPLAGKLEDRPKLLALLGSTLGNGDELWQQALLKNINQSMTSADRLMIGVNLKSDLQKTLAMYENPPGRDFVMTTILNLGFPADKIQLQFVPDEEKRQIKVVITVLEDLIIERGEAKIPYKAGEELTIFVSQKYDIGELAVLAQKAGLEMEQSFIDEKNQYELVVLKKSK